MSFIANLKNTKILQGLIGLLKKVEIPTFSGLNLYDLLALYINGIKEGLLTTRAAAISWSLFLSLFPFLLFVYSLLPYLPHFELIEEGIYQYLINRIFPKTQAGQIEDYVSVFAQKRVGSWFTILLAIAFATSGVRSFITGFNQTAHNVYAVRERSVVQQYSIAGGFTIFFTFLLLVFLWFIYYMLNPGTEFLKSLVDIPETMNLIKQLIIYVSAFVLFLFAVNFLYYFGVKFDGRFRKMLPGAVLTTFLFFLLTLGFGFYIDNFNNYSLLYGSISTLLIVMLFLYITVIIILLGFELNISLLSANAPDKKEEII